MDGEINPCERGFHFCENISNCFDNGYAYSEKKTRIAEVVAYGKVVAHKDGTKSCTDRLEIVREIPWLEVLKLCNTGDGNTGYCNTGDGNTGYWNTGDGNTGNRNTGYCNTGYWNTGDWNCASRSSGCFSTITRKITMFDKQSDWTYNDWFSSDARDILIDAPETESVWVSFSYMSVEEKNEHPEAEATGGYLRVFKVTEKERQEWWDDLEAEQQQAVMNLPNFDAEKFYKCTMIKVDGYEGESDGTVTD